MPKAITHEARLVDTDAMIASFAGEVAELGRKLGLLLVQLPPKLAFDAGLTARFFDTLRKAIETDIACEPRHASWFGDEAEALFARMRVARVAADPALGPRAAVPGGWRGVTYWRLHGSPAIYRSAYDDAALGDYGAHLRAAIDDGSVPWCIFDNTAAMAATGNALSLMAKISDKWGNARGHSA